MIRKIAVTPGLTMSRRGFNAGVLGAGLVSLGATRTVAQGTPVAPADGDGGASEFLFVADPAALAVYVYSIPDYTLTGQLNDVFFGVHNGLLALPDGRLLFSDDATKEVLAVTIDEAGMPTVSQRVAVNSGNRLVWSSVDPEFRYFVGASQIEDSDVQVANLIDLETFTNTEYEIQMVGDEELHAWVVGDPAVLIVSVGGQVDSYLLSDLDDGVVESLEMVPIEPGSHGAVADPLHDQFLMVSNLGFEVLDVSSGHATYEGLIPWDVDGFEGGRNSRPRLHPDGTHIFGRLNTAAPTLEEWAEVEVTTHISNVDDLSAQRFSLGKGNFGFRWGISDPYVLFAGHDGVDGAAYLVDADSQSETFGQVVTSIPLPLPSGAATPGEDSAGTESYLTTLTPDGRLGFVVHGGDGLVTIIDTTTQEAVGTIDVPTSLPASGYAVVVQSGITPVDLFGR